MSSGEPLWFCHECNAEMRPTMRPDPVCSRCESSFVEKLDDPDDDPRRPSAPAPENLPPGFETFLLSLHDMMGQSPTQGNPSVRRTTERPTTDNRFRFEIHSSGVGGNTHTFTVGGPNTLNPRPRRTSTGDVPTMSQFRRTNDPSRAGAMSGPLMAHYLTNFIGRHGGPDPFGGFIGMDTDPATRGRLGDYAFSQEALDQIITQLMEHSNAGQPVPATESIISDLPREVLEPGSATLEKECAVCKDQFQLNTDDPDEQVVVTLPCNHPFHEGCILPWLKSSGTCPVCRYALIAQPEPHAPGPDSGGSGSSSGPSSRPNRSPTQNGTHDRQGLFNTLFGFASGGSSGGSGTGSRGNSNRSGSSNHANIPGSWNEQID